MLLVSRKAEDRGVQLLSSSGEGQQQFSNHTAPQCVRGQQGAKRSLTPLRKASE